MLENGSFSNMVTEQRLLKLCVDELTPIITKIIHLLLNLQFVPASWKSALVRPTLKKLDLEAVYENFIPVNNLQFVSKIRKKQYSW